MLEGDLIAVFLEVDGAVFAHRLAADRHDHYQR